MKNLRMAGLLQAGAALDVRKVGKVARESCPGLAPDVFELDRFADGLDYCDAASERWIWSIGREESTGRILAATDARFYLAAGFECLWLR